MSEKLYKRHCVVDAQKYYITVVLKHIEPDESGKVIEIIDNYALKEGEYLIDANPPGNSFARPWWNGNEWAEGGTEREVAAWEASKIQELIIVNKDTDTPTLDERIASIESAMLATLNMMMGGVSNV